MTTVSIEASLTEAHAKVELLSRQLEGAQQQLDASGGLERDLQRLGREAEEMQRKADHSLEEKQVPAGVPESAFRRFVGISMCSLHLRLVVDDLSRRVIVTPLTAIGVRGVRYR